MKTAFALVTALALTLGSFSVFAADPAPAAVTPTVNSKNLSLDELKTRLRSNKAEGRILEKLIQQRESGMAKPMSCSGSNSCCCSAGWSGYCTTPSECSEVGGVCSSAAGC